jgi:membrane protease YdiL (CAAX protease family)
MALDDTPIHPNDPIQTETPPEEASPSRWTYDPRFSKAVTILSALVLVVCVGAVVWMATSLPRLDRVAAPERALSLMVTRTMEIEEGLKRAPGWEQALYNVTMGNSGSEQEQSITWYKELAEVSPDPIVQLHLAVLEGEAGQQAAVLEKARSWTTRESPFPFYARLVEGAYGTSPLGKNIEQALQAELAEAVPAGWFYDRLAVNLAQRAGDLALHQTVEADLAARGARLLERSRAFALVELAFMCIGTTVLVTLWIRRRPHEEALRVGSVSFPPPWPGGIGSKVLLRGGAIGAVLTLAFLFAAMDHASLRVLAIPLSNLPLLFLAYRHLFKPSGLSLHEGFGLNPAPSGVLRIAGAVSAIVAVSFIGEWVMGKIAEPLNLSSHWTEWFDGDLVWGAPSVMAASLIEYVVFAPVFEEVAFRGILFAILRRRFAWGPSAIISAGIFAISHGYGLLGFISVFWSGVLWAWAYEKTGSLLPGMIAHSLNNLLVCLSVIALLRL